MIDIRKYNIIKTQDILKHKQQFGMDYILKLVYVPSMTDENAEKEEEKKEQEDGKVGKKGPAKAKSSSAETYKKQIIIGTDSKETYSEFVRIFDEKKAAVM